MSSFTNVLVVLFFICSKVDGWTVSSRLSSSFPATKSSTLWYSQDDSSAAEDALRRTAAHLEKLQRQSTSCRRGDDDEWERVYRGYIAKSANFLKGELASRGLPRNGRKPDLAKRLTQDDLGQEEQEDYEEDPVPEWEEGKDAKEWSRVKTFANLVLSPAASAALGRADFHRPSSIQAAALPLLVKGESIILHAETGSGKTLAYLLPLTEAMWMLTDEEDEESFGLVMTPTRELAAQVAAVATTLAPPGSVRLVSRPTNLMNNGAKDRDPVERPEFRQRPRLFIGSARAICHSLFGNEQLPAPPTPKPLARAFLGRVQCLVLDEVDRLLRVGGKQRRKTSLPEKPAAIVTSSILRQTLGKTQVVAASATVGRPLQRELARVLGLPPQDGPTVVRADDQPVSASTRAVTIPNTVQHYYITPGSDASVGKLLTTAFQVIEKLTTVRMLMVLTRGCGITTQNAVGALKHFRCRPEPKSLLDALEAPGGTDQLMKAHSRVSGVAGIGESSSSNDEDSEGYLWVTGEDTVRGLHLDGLEAVLVVGRPAGPDEYTHIAGRTGRAGKSGQVISVISEPHAAALTSWESMLQIRFVELGLEDVSELKL